MSNHITTPRTLTLRLHGHADQDISHATNDDGTPSEPEIQHIVSALDPTIRDSYIEDLDGNYVLVDADSEDSIGYIFTS